MKSSCVGRGARGAYLAHGLDLLQRRRDDVYLSYSNNQTQNSTV